MRDVAGQRQFYTEAFGWAFSDFGNDYAATMSGDVDLGLNGDCTQWTAQLLPVIEVDDLEQTLGRIRAAGGAVTMPIFAFPGGRRFHFRDPHGHELAAMVREAIA
ncbi:VOC family protein [Novosphingobium sp. 1949]|uniref:VOC family protein n=1 Tax=Novosphingobium organovorum TaxID=2930092 RepID=A0ABT0BCV8_9SPHN|nr:VOC family protein [Novosphingobium organovorum]